MPQPHVSAPLWKRWSILTALVLAPLTLAIVLWTVVPPPVVGLLPPSIVAAELAPWFLLLGLLLVLLALPRHPALWRGWRWLALGCAAAVTVIAAVPLAQLGAAQRAAAAAMAVGFGDGPRPGATGTPRPAPVVLLDVLGGLPIPPVVVERALPLATMGGTPLTGDLFRAAGPGPHPVVIAIHGGGWNGGVRQEGATWNRYLASRGYLVLSIDYRLAPATTYPGQIDDVAAAIAWVRAKATTYDADPGNIVLLGRSAGAQLAMIAAWRDGAIRGVVDLYGPVDMVVGYEDPGSRDLLNVRKLLVEYLGGTPDQQRARYIDASPITHARRRGPPTLMLYGTRDNVVEIRFGRLLHDTLRANGTPVALVEIPWSDHAFDVVPNGLGGQLALYHLERFLGWVTAPKKVDNFP